MEQKPKGDVISKEVAWAAWKQVYIQNCTFEGDEFQGYDWGKIYEGEFLEWWDKTKGIAKHDTLPVSSKTEHTDPKAAPKGDDVFAVVLTSVGVELLAFRKNTNKITDEDEQSLTSLITERIMRKISPASQFAALQAVKWVQASERLPGKTGYYFIKSKYGQMSCYFSADKKRFNNYWNHITDSVSWLEEKMPNEQNDDAVRRNEDAPKR